MTTPLPPTGDFAEITRMIAAARQRAVQAVNTTLIATTKKSRHCRDNYRGRIT